MAETLGDTNIEGILIPLEVEDKASPKIKELSEHFLKVAEKMREMGKSKKEILQFLRDLVVNIQIANPKIKDLAKNLTSAYEESLKKIGGVFRNGASPIHDINDFLKTAGAAFIAFKAAVTPGRALRSFAEECTNINFKLSTMAMTAGMSVEKLSQLGNAFRAYGGSAADAARGQKSYELAMEKRRRGEGDGGVYTEVWRRYGIRYDERENYQDYFKRLVQWSEGLGTGRYAEAQRLNVKEKLGLTDAEFRVMKGGMRAWEEEQRINEQYKASSKEAAKAAESLTKSTARLNAAWQDLKNKAFVALAPILEKVYGLVKGLVNALSSLPKGLFQTLAWVASIVSLFTGVGAAFKGVKLVGSLLGAFKGGGLLAKFGSLFSFGGRGVAGASTVASSVSSSSSIVRTAGSSAIGRFGGWLGIGTNIGNLVANGITAGKVSALNDNVGRIITIITSWMQVWMLRMGANGFKGSKKELINYYNQAMWNMDWKSDAIRNNFAVGMANAHRQQRWLDQSAYGYYKDRVDKDNENSGVSVGKIEITVNSEAANAKEVADAVHEKIIEEFRILASQDNTTEMR